MEKIYEEDETGTQRLVPSTIVRTTHRRPSTPLIRFPTFSACAQNPFPLGLGSLPE